MHAATATAGGGFDQHRIADAFGQFVPALGVIIQHAVGTGYARYAGLLHGFDGGGLVAHQANGFGAWSDEGEATAHHAFGEVGVLRHEAVAGVNGVGAGHFRGGNDGGHVEVAFAGRRRANAHRLIGEQYVFLLAISAGVNRDSGDAEFTAGALNAQCDFAAIGDQDFFERWGHVAPIR